MPLVMLCGFPASGKSTAAAELKAFLVAQGKTVKLLNDAELGLNPREYAADPTKEKAARGVIKSAVAREMSSSTIVIVDSPNYIKVASLVPTAWRNLI